MPAATVRRNNRKVSSPEPVAVTTADPPVADSPALVEVASAGFDHRNRNVEQVAHLAYSYWKARGYQGGSPEEDWLRAEEQLRAPK